jgi:hypothetical protein
MHRGTLNGASQSILNEPDQVTFVFTELSAKAEWIDFRNLPPESSTTDRNLLPEPSLQRISLEWAGYLSISLIELSTRETKFLYIFLPVIFLPKFFSGKKIKDKKIASFKVSKFSFWRIMACFSFIKVTYWLPFFLQTHLAFQADGITRSSKRIRL